MKKVFILCALAALGFTSCNSESATTMCADSTATTCTDTTMSDSAIIAADTTVVAADTTK